MASLDVCTKRNSGWVGGESGYRRKRPRTDPNLIVSRLSTISTHSDQVSQSKGREFEKDGGASQSTRQRSDLELTAQNKQKENDQQAEPRREKLDLALHAGFCTVHQDSEESEEEFEGITYEEFKETEGYTLFSKYLRGTAKNSNGN